MSMGMDLAGSTLSVDDLVAFAPTGRGNDHGGKLELGYIVAFQQYRDAQPPKVVIRKKNGTRTTVRMQRDVVRITGIG